MRYQVQHIEDCSNRELARVRLTEALAATGHPEAAITVRVIRDSQEAAEMAFHGSPTILADGIDLFPTTAESGAVACRVYATPAGLAGTPTVAQMVDAIRPNGTFVSQLRGAVSWPSGLASAAARVRPVERGRPETAHRA